jgi:anti-anti-sigma regulatory factor
VGELRPGDHAWLAFANGEEQDRVIGDFVFDGLNTSEKVVYIADCLPWQLPGMLSRHGIDPTPFVDVGQLRLLPREKACLTDGRFDPELLVSTLRREIGKAFDEEYRAVRFTADLSWALRQPGGRGLVVGCEGDFEQTIAPSTTTMAICQVARGSCTREELDALRSEHEVLVEANPDFADSTLKIVRTFQPYGLRIEGELDGARKLELAKALDPLTRRACRVHLDFGRLDFISFDSLNTLAAYAMRMPRGAGLVLDNLPPALAGIIETVGWHRLPGVIKGDPWVESGGMS